MVLRHVVLLGTLLHRRGVHIGCMHSSPSHCCPLHPVSTPAMHLPCSSSAWTPQPPASTHPTAYEAGACRLRPAPVLPLQACQLPAILPHLAPAPAPAPAQGPPAPALPLAVPLPQAPLRATGPPGAPQQQRALHLAGLLPAPPSQPPPWEAARPASQPTCPLRWLLSLRCGSPRQTGGPSMVQTISRWESGSQLHVRCPWRHMAPALTC